MIINEDTLVTIFCLADDFCKHFELQCEQIALTRKTPKGDTRRKRKPGLTISELMTLTILFHEAEFRHLKCYYTRYAKQDLKRYFPNMPSYSQFIHLMPRIVFHMCVFLHGFLGKCTGISFVDSTVLTVCNIRRSYSHRVFKGIAKRAKTSTGWFFGFKLHLIINDQGEILSFMLTAGNVDDRKPIISLAKELWGKLFGDRGYISGDLFNKLWDQGVQLITRLRKGMHNKLIPLWDMFILRKRGLIESVHNKLKNSCQIEHHRHRSPMNFLVNLLSGLVAYSCNPNKPTLGFKKTETALLMAA